MNSEQTGLFLSHLSRILRIDAVDSFEILKLIYSGYTKSRERKTRLFNEFSFVVGEDGNINSTIRVLNLLFPKNIHGNLKDFKMKRLKNILDAFDFAEDSGKYAYLQNVRKVEKVADFFNKNSNWLFQFGLELSKDKHLRTKIYFGNINRKIDDPFYIIKILEKISETFGITYNKLVNSIIFDNKIDAIAIDLMNGDIGLKIYEYSHFPDKKQMDFLLAKYEAFGHSEEDRTYDNFKTLVRKHKIYDRKNFDTMFTYRFAPQSMDLKSVKINIHLNPVADGNQLFCHTAIAKQNKPILDFMRNNDIKVSFIGHEPKKIFFYVR
ncbi:MAG: hypothetical protein QMD77_00730 [Patescibacteria group bacterium]|nr:hypothetical protein [Patescibacteria group bacterium]